PPRAALICSLCTSPPPPESCTLSLHDALPISDQGHPAGQRLPGQPHGLEDERDARQRVDHRQPVHVRRPAHRAADHRPFALDELDRKSTRLNSSHVKISYAVFCLKKKKQIKTT